MKLKTLLLGSAAALVAVTGARAADAVIAEPEAVEYVRVCDLYGAKWFYIPGTETCLQIDGYVRATYTYNDFQGASETAVAAANAFNPNVPGATVLNPGGDTANWRTRARVNIRSRNETALGTLEGWIRYQGGESGNGPSIDDPVGVDRALLSLGAGGPYGLFRLGYSDSYVTTHHNYGFYTDRNDGFYDYDQATFFDYTYAANGFSATAGIQTSQGAAGAAASRLFTLETDAKTLDYYLGLGYSGSWGGVAASWVYDNELNDGSFKISADFNLIENLSVRGWYQTDGGDTRYTTGAFGPFNAPIVEVDDQWGVAARYNFNPMFSVAAGYTEADYGVFGNEAYVTIDAFLRPVPGLTINPQVAFSADDTFPAFGLDGDQYSIRVTRSF